MTNDTQKKIQIREFDLNRISFNSKIVVIGKPASGKSTLIKCLCSHFAHLYPVAKIFSGSEDTNHFYEEMFPPLFIDSNYEDEKLEDFAKRQKMAIRDKSSGVNPHLNPKALLIMDDCSGDPRYLKRPIIQTTFKNGRHWEMLFILALQYALDVGPAVRTSIDYTFIFRETNPKNLKSLHENYAGIIHDYKDFEDMMAQLTGDYHALVIDNRNQSMKMEDCVFYFKAPLKEPSFKFCCDEFRKWGETRYNPNYALEI